jgi:hypothetical protein
MAFTPQSLIRKSDQAAHNQELSGSLFLIGSIDDAFAYAGVYTVRSGGWAPFTAVDIRQTSCVPLGARSINTYQPKTRVLIYFDPMLDTPIILGAVPRATASAQLVLPTSIVPRSRAGFVEDPAHYASFTDPRTHYADFSGGKAIDSLPGDWGSLNDLGVGFVAGRLMAMLKASEGAQIQAFWGDDLLRIVGYNYELFNALGEDRRYNDEGECNGIEMETAYAWESLGSAKKENDPSRTESGELKFGAEYTPSEPKVDDQLMWPRRVLFKGYLGDLRREIICAPDFDSDPINKFSAETTKYRGLAQMHQSSDGTIFMRSAKAVVLEKYSIIPVPKEKKAPEDPTGDTKRSSDKFAGEGANVPDYKWGSDDPSLRAAQFYDYIAYALNKYSTDGLVKHKKDWYYPEESDIEKPVDKTVYDKSLDVLKQKFVLELPTSVGLKIDHRTGRDSVRYYKARSVIAQGDDGSILIEDGFGSSIHMSGGNIQITCPGDVFLRPGRSLVAMAPFDAVIRAGNSADISAAKKDVRIKAERNCMIMGGNDSSPYGGVLIESRANSKVTAADLTEDGERTKLRGIILKSPRSNVYSYSLNTYIGATQQVTMDVPEGIVYTSAREVRSKLTSLNILSTSGNKQLMSLNPGKSVISTMLDIGGAVRIADAGGGDSLTVGGSVIIHGGMKIGSGIQNNGPFQSRTWPYVVEMKRDVDLGTKPQLIAQEIKQDVADANESIQETEKEVRTDVNSPVQLKSKLGFSFRDTVLDLKLDSDTFVLYESRWQQLLRNGQNGSGTEWVEPEVKSMIGGKGQPYPGYTGWSSWSAYGKVDLQNFDLTKGYAKMRDSLKEQGKSPTKATLKSAYKVVKFAEG